MKRMFTLLLAVLLGLPSLAPAAAKSQPKTPKTVSEPTIVSVRGRVVRVAVPEGYDRVSLEVLTPATRGLRMVKAAQPGWKVKGVKFVRGEARMVSFKLRALTPPRNLRVAATRHLNLPAAFLTGLNTFDAEVPEVASSSRMVEGDVTSVSGTSTLNTSSVLSLDNAVSSTTPTETREVAEADIWRLDGDRLYFFNELRGLQVFDLTDDANPTLMGSLRMPASGEDMYLLDHEHVVLIKRVQSWNWWGGFNQIFLRPVLSVIRASDMITLNATADLQVTTGTSLTLAATSASTFNVIRPQTEASAKHEIVVTDVRTGTPEVTGRVSFEGTLRESRLVGRVLYLATDFYGRRNEGESEQWGTRVLSFDLHDPAHPVQVGEVFLGGWANAINATDRYLFVAKSDYSNWNQSQVEVVDISDPNGMMEAVSTLTVAGSVPDKFKMNLNGEVLTVVSQFSQLQEQTGENTDSSIWRWNRWITTTRVATFSLAVPTTPKALGSLDLAPGESLFATRFDGDRLYVVTAVRSWDPLFIVDLSDPAKPTAVGELEMPGFSTYIQPLGDRLVTIGLVANQPTVSLFDVHDPTSPELLSRLQLGGTGWTSSEAVWNEKAFGVLPENNLIMLPLSGYDGNGYSSSVQLIDLNRDALVRRGVIEGQFSPRRATAHRDSLVAVAPTHLVTVDAKDRDRPVIKADIEIAWPVNRVFHQGRHLVQLTGDAWDVHPSITISPAADPNETLRVVDLDPLPVAGAEVRDGVLYLLQSTQAGMWHYWYYWSTESDSVEKQPNARHILTTYDLTQLPNMRRLGQVTVDANTKQNWAAWEGAAVPLWVSDTTLVWVGGGTSKYQRLMSWYQPASYKVTTGELKEETIVPDGYWYESGGYSRAKKLFAFDVSESTSPKFVSRFDLGEDQPWEVSAPLASEGNVLASYRDLGESLQESEAQEFSRDTWRNDPQAFAKHHGGRRNRDFLLDVDYSAPETPVLRPTQPSLPGRLVGHSRHGRILYTQGQRRDAAGRHVSGKPALHASAYDGELVHLVDQLSLDGQGVSFTQRDEILLLLHPQPTHVWQAYEGAYTMMIDWYGWYGGSYVENPEKTSLDTWKLSDTGKLVRLKTLTLEHEQSLTVVEDLALLQGDRQDFRVLDINDAIDLRDLGVFTSTGWSWPQLGFADGDSQSGLWIPLGQYGVERLDFVK